MWMSVSVRLSVCPSVRLSVRLSVCQHDISLTAAPILLKFCIHVAWVMGQITCDFERIRPTPLGVAGGELFTTLMRWCNCISTFYHLIEVVRRGVEVRAIDLCRLYVGVRFDVGALNFLSPFCFLFITFAFVFSNPLLSMLFYISIVRFIL